VSNLTVEARMDDCCSHKRETLDLLAKGRQRRVLVIVMVVNAVMFVVEFGFGLIARSSAMMADRLICWEMPPSMRSAFMRWGATSAGRRAPLWPRAG
jgi:Co/Zn/Cd efflux system component